MPSITYTIIPNSSLKATASILYFSINNINAISLVNELKMPILKVSLFKDSDVNAALIGDSR